MLKASLELLKELLSMLQTASRKQLLLCLGILVLIGIAAGLWEHWTAGFRLTKLERAAGILEHIATVPGNDATNAKRIADHITHQVAAILDVPSASLPQHSYLQRVAIGGAGWFGLNMLIALTTFRRNERKASTFLGMTFASLLPALVAGLFPDGSWPWRHLLWYPVGTTVGIFFLALVAAIIIPSFTKARNAAQRNACLRNLRILHSAKEQAALEKKYQDGQVVTEEDVTPFFPKGFHRATCPSGGHYDIATLGQSPRCSVHGSLTDTV